VWLGFVAGPSGSKSINITLITRPNHHTVGNPSYFTYNNTVRTHAYFNAHPNAHLLNNAPDDPFEPLLLNRDSFGDPNTNTHTISFHTNANTNANSNPVTYIVRDKVTNAHGNTYHNQVSQSTNSYPNFYPC
jgi:hypothetical protein